MESAFQAAAETGIPIINCGPGGTSGDEESLQATIDSLGRLADRAEAYGVTLCVKAHVGASIYDTPTTLRAMEALSSPAFGIDMDPSHIHRANENPVEAIKAVLPRRPPCSHPRLQGSPGRSRRAGRPGQWPGRYRSGGIHPRLARRRLRRSRQSRSHRSEGVLAGAVLRHRRGDAGAYAGVFAGLRGAVGRLTEVGRGSDSGPSVAVMVRPG